MRSTQDIQRERGTLFERLVLAYLKTYKFMSNEAVFEYNDNYFIDNITRLKKQRKNPIIVILGNPPYSACQNDENEDNYNISYPELEKRLISTYGDNTESNATHTLYDSYIKAIRWSTDILGDTGIIGFITANSFIDKKSTDGMRKNY